MVRTPKEETDEEEENCKKACEKHFPFSRQTCTQTSELYRMRQIYFVWYCQSVVSLSASMQM